MKNEINYDNKGNKTDFTVKPELNQSLTSKTEFVGLKMNKKLLGKLRERQKKHNIETLSETIYFYLERGLKRTDKDDKQQEEANKVDINQLRIGVEYIKQLYGSENSNWDKIYFPRYSKTVKELLLLCNNDIKRVMEALDWSNNYAKRKGFFWKPENTVTYFGMFEQQVPQEISTTDFKTMSEKFGYIKPVSKAEAIKQGFIKE